MRWKSSPGSSRPRSSLSSSAQIAVLLVLAALVTWLAVAGAVCLAAMILK
jgi:hypothetical protein